MSYARTRRYGLGQTTQPSCPPGQSYVMGTCVCPQEAATVPKPACCIPGPPIDACGHRNYDCSHCPPTGQAVAPHCSPGYDIVSSPPDSAGNVHQYCVRGKTAFIYDAIGVVKQIPGAYADMITHPTAGLPAVRLTSLATGALGIAGLVTWIRHGRGASTRVKVATPLLIATSLAAAGLRNGFMSL